MRCPQRGKQISIDISIIIQLPKLSQSTLTYRSLLLLVPPILADYLPHKNNIPTIAAGCIPSYFCWLYLLAHLVAGVLLFLVPLIAACCLHTNESGVVGYTHGFVGLQACLLIVVFAPMVFVELHPYHSNFTECYRDSLKQQFQSRSCETRPFEPSDRRNRSIAGLMVSDADSLCSMRMVHNRLHNVVHTGSDFSIMVTKSEWLMIHN